MLAVHASKEVLENQRYFEFTAGKKKKNIFVYLSRILLFGSGGRGSEEMILLRVEAVVSVMVIATTRAGNSIITSIF